MLWSGENSVGKRSIILERRKSEGLAIVHQLTARADIVCCNMMDDQMARLGVDAATLAQSNPRAIGLQIAATRGERHGPRHHDKGYDPSIQGTTGVMMRFGGPETPTFHGFASAVDYLCGYLGTLSGVLALCMRGSGAAMGAATGRRPRSAMPQRCSSCCSSAPGATPLRVHAASSRPA